MRNFRIFFPSRKQCVHSDSRLEFLKELMKNIPDLAEELNDTNYPLPPIVKLKQIATSESDEEPYVPLYIYSSLWFYF